MHYEELLDKCKEKMRYGDLWTEFTVQELLDYARIKAKRGELLRKRGQLDKFEDDLMDAANILLCAVLKEKTGNETVD